MKKTGPENSEEKSFKGVDDGQMEGQMMDDDGK